MELTPPALEGRVLTTRLPEKSLARKVLNSGKVVDNPGEKKQCIRRVGDEEEEHVFVV